MKPHHPAETWLERLYWQARAEEATLEEDWWWCDSPGGHFQH